MKKILACLILSFLFLTGAFASSDIQIKCCPIDYYTFSGYVFPISIAQHGYYGGENTPGVGLTFDYGLATIEMEQSYAVLAGPSFSAPVGKKAQFQLITGIKYKYSNVEGGDGYIGSYYITNKTISNLFAWGNDFQIKFNANKLCSIAIGSTFSAGANFIKYIQKATPPYFNTTTQTIKGRAYKACTEFGPYIAIGINF